MKRSPRCICSKHSRTACMRCDRVVMTLPSPDFRGIELTSLRFCNFTTVGTVDLLSRLSVLRFAARCCVCHAVLSLKIPASLKFCTHVEESWREETSVKFTAHLSKQVLARPCTDSLLGFPQNAFDVNLRSLNCSKSRALLSLSVNRGQEPFLSSAVSSLSSSCSSSSLFLILLFLLWSMKLRSDFRTAVTRMNRLHRESGEE